jgi:large subunit ribosomal protein L17
MRHSNNQRKFGRTKNARKALMKGLALSLIMREKILTTEAKAKETRPYVEKIVTQAKTNTVYSKRLVASKLYNRQIELKKLFDVIAPKYKDRNGGYTRITKMPARKSDGSPMAYIEFV